MTPSSPGRGTPGDRREGGSDNGHSPGPRPSETALEEHVMRSRVSPPPLFSLDCGSVGPAPGPPGLAATTAAFSQIARARLGRSSNRVDELLDAAVADGSSIGDAIARVRRLSIRGVMPATLSALADELHRTLVERPDQGPRGPRSKV